MLEYFGMHREHCLELCVCFRILSETDGLAPISPKASECFAQWARTGPGPGLGRTYTYTYTDTYTYTHTYPYTYTYTHTYAYTYT